MPLLYHFGKNSIVLEISRLNHNAELIISILFLIDPFCRRISQEIHTSFQIDYGVFQLGFLPGTVHNYKTWIQVQLYALLFDLSEWILF